ncbi:MAG: hypothetical protein N2112_07550 [Gemmataceae bacterium]|nr:hypothetical protein [Gemmataceae bacterium]
MDWQYLLTYLTIGLAVTFLARSFVNGVLGKGQGCGSGCKKCVPSEVPSPHPKRIALPVVKVS